MHKHHCTTTRARTRGTPLRRAVTALAAATALVGPAISASTAEAYNVVGTGGTLHVHPSPSIGSPVTANLRDGTPITIVCQTSGDNVQGSIVWDQISSPASGYISDYYTNTPGNKTWSPRIPQCGTPPPPRPHGSVFCGGTPALQCALAMNGQVNVPAAARQHFKIGPYWSGYCEAFIGYVFGDRPYASAIQDYNAHKAAGQIQTGVPPAGAVVYWNTGGYGHVGISIGHGQEISTYGYSGWRAPIQIHSYLYFHNYLGWANP